MLEVIVLTLVISAACIGAMLLVFRFLIWDSSLLTILLSYVVYGFFCTGVYFGILRLITNIHISWGVR